MEVLQIENDVLYLMLENKEYRREAISRITPEYFSDVQYQSLYRQIKENDLICNGNMSISGVNTLLVEADNNTPVYWQMLLTRLHEEYFKNSIAKFALLAQNNKADVSDLKKLADELSVYQANQTLSAKEYAGAMWEAFSGLGDVERRKANSIDVFPEFASNLLGYRKGDVHIISAETGAGKSALALNIIADMLQQGRNVCYVNTELSDEEITARMLSILNRKNKAININDIMHGKVHQSKELVSRVVLPTFDKIFKSGLSYRLEPQLTLASLESIMRDGAKNGVECICIDYIGRFDSISGNKEIWLQLQNMTRILKTLAQELNIAVFIVSQVNKDGALAGASYMSHEASILLHCRKMTEKELADARAKNAPFWNYLIEIKKARNGRTGILPAKFIGEKCLFILNREEAQSYECCIPY